MRGSTMGLPSGHKPMTREEWLKLAKDPDPQKRKPVANCLRDLGHAPSDYMPWDAEQRVDKIMKAQEDDAADEKPASTKGKADEKPASGGGGGLDAATKKKIEAMAEQTDAMDKRSRKIHDLLVILCLSIPAAKGNAEEMDIELKLLGNG